MEKEGIKYKKFDLEKAMAGEKVIYLYNEGEYLCTLKGGSDFPHVFKITARASKDEYIVKSNDKGLAKGIHVTDNLYMAPIKRKMFIHIYSSNICRGGYRSHISGNNDPKIFINPGDTFIKTIEDYIEE